MKKVFYLAMVAGLSVLACGTPEPGTGNGVDSTTINSQADTTTSVDTTINRDSMP